ncbi:sugar ABC transporter ATP-binding protein [Pusillimonas caeni]|uniref:sugar ABC transporter ATP-binding protein n=1 Tax=Pusillimonas caeni TaxID=1348472 RepID=UPI001FD777FC|nr:sugar ABC transporter ATP-binding protein [Pusillimonas caeni]
MNATPSILAGALLPAEAACFEPGESAPATHALLQVRNVSRQFPGVQALTDMSLDVHAGEVHVLFGENGAGKSTLMNIICGALAPSSGQLLIDGKSAVFRSVQEARKAGVSVVHQEFSLAPDLTVEENLFLANEFCSWAGLLKKQAMHELAKAHFQRLGFNISVRARVSGLSRAECQMVEIAKAALSNPRILILDEPTASLTEVETGQLFTLIRALKSQGVGIIYISHRISEIQAIGDRVTVMRDGRFIKTVRAANTDKTQLVELMTGRSFGGFYPHIRFQPGEPVLEVSGLETSKGLVKHASITVRSGEIVGLAGLVGCGKSEIGRACFGIEPKIAGSIRVDGVEQQKSAPGRFIESGVAYVTNDRIHEGMLLTRNVRENLSLASLALPALRKKGLLARKAEKRESFAMARRMSLMPLDIERAARSFSGGNMQKALLGRFLARRPRLLILDEPTVGIDVNAKAEIYAVLEQLVGEGMAVLLISSDLPEVLSLSNRVYVVREGAIVDELVNERKNEEEALSGFFVKE